MNRFEAERAKKLETIRQLGFNPYGDKLSRIPHKIANVVKDVKASLTNRHDTTISDYRTYFSKDISREGLGRHIAGRIISKNNKGKLKFFWIQDDTGSIQIMCSKDQFADKEWELISCLEIGDIISVGGLGIVTQAGEITLFAGGYKKISPAVPDSPLEKVEDAGVTLLCKSLTHPPEKYHGIKDEEVMVRQRYLPMIYDEHLLQNLIQRSQIISRIRKFVENEGFLEVETPILTAQESGATAKPFDTHHNALDMDLKLRIAPELPLKKLLVGGMTKIYEIGKVFRNEGIDKTHNPEFTLMELYWAYADLYLVKDLTQRLIINIAKHMPNENLFQNWKTIPYNELFYAKYRMNIFTNKEYFIDEARKNDFVDENYWNVIEHLFDKEIQPTLIEPTFVIDYPTELCILARPNDDGLTSARFELFVNGMELANAYTELNDPSLQEIFFAKQTSVDKDFLNALKVGMPPAGGLGIGIDRLVMILLGLNSVRDVINFPLTRLDE